MTECNKRFNFPIEDCSLLPIVHSSAEELAIYVSNELVQAFTLEALLVRLWNIHERNSTRPRTNMIITLSLEKS